MDAYLTGPLEEVRDINQGLACALASSDPEEVLVNREDLYRQFKELIRYVPMAKRLEAREPIALVHQEIRALEPGIHVHHPQRAAQVVETIDEQIAVLAAL
jgi:hypothetical protein